MTLQICGKCNFENSMEADHCNNCGHYFRPAGVFIPILPTTETPGLQERLKKHAGLIIFLGVFCVLALLLFMQTEH